MTLLDTIEGAFRSRGPAFVRHGLRLGFRAWKLTSRTTPGSGMAFLSLGRSGTTVVGAMLGRNPGVWWDGEPLHREVENAWDRRVLGCASPSMDAVARSLALVPTCRYVASFKPWQLIQHSGSIDAGLAALEAMGMGRFLVFERRNLVRYLLSVRLGQASKVWHVRAGEVPKRRQVPLVVAPPGRPGLVAQLDRHARYYAELREALAHREAHWLTYEDHVLRDPQEAYRLACEALGVPAAQPRVPLGRTNPYSTREVLANFDEVAEALAGTPYLEMLDA